MTVKTKILGIGMTERNVPKVMSGAKTQTRRIEACLRACDKAHSHIERRETNDGDAYFRLWHKVTKENRTANCYQEVAPRHQVGDRLYIKEALKKAEYQDRHLAKYKSDGQHVLAPIQNVIRSDDVCRGWQSDDGKPWKNNVIPARYMPRSAARTFIEITDVRCERIQDISVEDIKAEGCDPQIQNHLTYRDAFQDLWNDTSGKDAWERNDWVFAYTFKLLAEADLTAGF